MDKTQTHYLAALCEKGYLKDVKLFVSQNPDIPYNSLCAALHHSILCGHLDIVEYLFSHNFKENIRINEPQDVATFLETACEYGHLDIVKFLLKSPKLQEHADIDANYGMALIKASGNGKLNIIKYLFTFPEIKDCVWTSNQNIAFLCGCNNGHLNIVEYMLTSPELDKKADIHLHQEMGLIGACQNNKLKIVQFLLTSPKLQDHANIEPHLEKIMSEIAKKGHLSVIKYILKHYKVNLDYIEETHCTDPVWKYLKEYKEIQNALNELNKIENFNSNEHKIKVL